MHGLREAGRGVAVPAGGATLFLARALRRGGEELALRRACRIVRETVARRPSIEEAMAFAYTFELVGFDVAIRPLQIPGEIRLLLERIAAERPRAIVEVGAANGGTLFLLATVAADDAKIVSIDVPAGYAKRRERLYRSFARPGQRIELLRADSHDPRTVKETRRLLGDRRADVLLIDGDHSYDGVRSDYLGYSGLVRPGGMIAFHDIVPGPERHVGEVPRFWSGLKESVEYEEVVQDWGQGDSGFGIVRVGAG